jgi:hypothetical protein
MAADESQLAAGTKYPKLVIDDTGCGSSVPLPIPWAPVPSNQRLPFASIKYSSSWNQFGTADSLGRQPDHFAGHRSPLVKGESLMKTDDRPPAAPPTCEFSHAQVNTYCTNDHSKGRVAAGLQTEVECARACSCDRTCQYFERGHQTQEGIADCFLLSSCDHKLPSTVGSSVYRKKTTSGVCSGLNCTILPPTPRPPAPLHPAVFDMKGVIDYMAFESTPIQFYSRRLLMETITLSYPRGINYSNCSSYFRLRDLDSGAIVHNLIESCNHSFGSAFVDILPNGTQVLWIFGSAWWRDNTMHGRLHATQGSPWSGSCATPATCVVESFRTTDHSLQSWSRATALHPGRSTFNVDVAAGKPSATERRTYIMAAEQLPEADHPAGSSWVVSYFYIKTCHAESDSCYDLSRGWTPLSTSHVLAGPNSRGGCPTIRWSDGWFYVMSGGYTVYLDRSRNLTSWEPSSRSPDGAVLQSSPAIESIPFRWYKPTGSEQRKLDYAKLWDKDVSDLDFGKMADGSLMFVYMAGDQGDTIFSALGTFAGSMAQWFTAQFV